MVRLKFILYGVLAMATGISVIGIGYAYAATHSVQVADESGYRVIRSNGIPDHAPGQFPNRNNPNSISEQSHVFRMTLNPEVADETTKLGMHPFGVAINGVPFDPGAAEFWNRDFQSGWQYAALTGKLNLGMDEHNAHVQPTGAYHYHGTPTGLVGETGTMQLIGYAADGFPIYGPYGFTDPMNADSRVRRMNSSYQLKKGTRPDGPGGTYDGTFLQDFEFVPGFGDLDECNGRFGVTPDYPDGIYHYYTTDAYPFIPRLFRGTPDQSFMRHGPPGGGRGPGGGRHRPGHHPPPHHDDGRPWPPPPRFE